MKMKRPIFVQYRYKGTQMGHFISRVTGPKFTKFLRDVGLFIGGVDAPFGVSILQ